MPRAKTELTSGEKMIFAAVWAAEFQKQMAEPRPRDCIGYHAEALANRAKWEAGNVDRATEIAATAVLYIRESAARAPEVQTDETTAMIKSMLA